MQRHHKIQLIAGCLLSALAGVYGAGYATSHNASRPQQHAGQGPYGANSHGAWLPCPTCGAPMWSDAPDDDAVGNPAVDDSLQDQGNPFIGLDDNHTT